MVGEMLSKVAIIVTFIMLAKVGFVSLVAAGTLATVGVGLSFLRDANLRQRGIVRRLPCLGWVWILSLLVASLLMAVVRILADEEVLGTPAIVMMAGLVSIGVRGICIGVDGFIDWIFSVFWRAFTLFLGTKANRDDHATVQETRTYRTAIAEPVYSSFVPPPSWIYQCPQCGVRVEHKIDICWNCGYGSDEPLGSS